MNPFRYGQIVNQSDFCKRPKLEAELKSFIESGQNVYVQGERRIGKSSLVSETIRKLKRLKMVYIDLLEAKTIDDIVKRIVMAIISMENRAGFVEKVFKKLAHVRPVASVDPATGLPVVSIDVSAALQPDSISGVLDLIGSYHSKNKPLLVVLDEFQDVLNLKNIDTAKS